MTFEQNFTVLSSSLATLPSIANDGWKWALHHQAQNGSSKRLSPEGYLWTATFLGVIAIGSTLANLSVIIVLFKNPQLRTPVNLMLLNLTVSDLLISVCGTPWTAVAAFHGHWIFGEGLCQAYAFATGVSGIASIGSLSVIALERYWLITHSGTISKPVTVLAVFLVWVYALAGMLPTVTGWSSLELESPNIACAPNWESPEFADRSYIVYLIVFALIIPAGIICFCYGSIIVFVKRHARSGQGVAKSQRNVTKMISVMIAAFFIAWMPYTIVSATAVFGFGDLITAPIATMPAVFAKASFLYNPIIYIFMNPQARSALCAILTCGSRRDVSQWLHRPSTFLRRRLGTFASVYAESPDGSKDSEMGGSIVNGRRAVARLRAASIKMFTAKAAEREDTSVPDILTESKV
ncbi:hypothetical protein RvY_00653 [Ramazzottius varieornatus]|uniref:G-protein coupled receptors family 1 profile domain-containing protein n=1 Tax=Ramazzottius varieornatus TaxID=947166 RepID=A0A1D1UDJ0_RAMVA|nr:hypothetical protein RvY_00653 [Ramazzottius varieornatus]